MRRVSGKAGALLAVGFLGGIVFSVITEEPDSAPALVLPPPNRVEVVERTEVPIVPDECKDLVRAALAFHDAIHERSAVNGQEEDLLDQMRAAAAGGDFVEMDRLSKKYDQLMVKAYGSDVVTGKRGSGNQLAELVRQVDLYTKMCDRATTP